MLRASGVPDVQGGSGGLIPSLPLHPTRSHDSPVTQSRCAAMRSLRVSLQHFPSPKQRLAEADWSGHFVDTNDRYEQGLERDPPFGKRTPGELGERHRRAPLRYKAKPRRAGKDRRHGRMASGPAEAVAQAHHPQPRQEQRDRKSTRLNSSHLGISYAVFCLKKKTHTI